MVPRRHSPELSGHAQRPRVVEAGYIGGVAVMGRAGMLPSPTSQQKVNIIPRSMPSDPTSARGRSLFYQGTQRTLAPNGVMSTDHEHRRQP